uniref:BAF chromatin remodeling complex subunit BCL11A b n=1 Tax=Eptatretus burgeri TaxID=7764 RepID=A0A8C4QJ13_EPTBU
MSRRKQVKPLHLSKREYPLHPADSTRALLPDGTEDDNDALGVPTGSLAALPTAPTSTPARNEPSSEEGDEGRDLLTCGACHATFPLAHILLFIRHKVRRCRQPPPGPGKAPGESPPRGQAREAAVQASATGEDLEEDDDDDEDDDEEEGDGEDGGEEEVRGGETATTDGRLRDGNELRPAKEHDCQLGIASQGVGEPGSMVCTTCRHPFSSAWQLLQHAQTSHGLCLYVEASTLGSPRSSRQMPAVSLRTTSPCGNGGGESGAVDSVQPTSSAEPTAPTFPIGGGPLDLLRLAGLSVLPPTPPLFGSPPPPQVRLPLDLAPVRTSEDLLASGGTVGGGNNGSGSSRVMGASPSGLHLNPLPMEPGMDFSRRLRELANNTSVGATTPSGHNNWTLNTGSGAANSNNNNGSNTSTPPISPPVRPRLLHSPSFAAPGKALTPASALNFLAASAAAVARPSSPRQTLAQVGSTLQLSTPKACEFCGKTFKASKLKRHVCTHHAACSTSPLLPAARVKQEASSECSPEPGTSDAPPVVVATASVPGGGSASVALCSVVAQYRSEFAAAVTGAATFTTGATGEDGDGSEMDGNEEEDEDEEYNEARSRPTSGSLAPENELQRQERKPLSSADNVVSLAPAHPFSEALRQALSEGATGVGSRHGKPATEAVSKAASDRLAFESIFKSRFGPGEVTQQECVTLDALLRSTGGFGTPDVFAARRRVSSEGHGSMDGRRGGVEEGINGRNSNPGTPVPAGSLGSPLSSVPLPKRIKLEREADASPLPLPLLPAENVYSQWLASYASSRQFHKDSAGTGPVAASGVGTVSGSTSEPQARQSPFPSSSASSDNGSLQLSTSASSSPPQTRTPQRESPEDTASEQSSGSGGRARSLNAGRSPPAFGGSGSNGSNACEFCGKVFKNGSNLTVHRRSHTGERPYKCELCSYACAQSSKLTRHMKTHGQRTFRCDICQMPFNMHSRLESHMRKWHGEQGHADPQPKVVQ